MGVGMVSNSRMNARLRRFLRSREGNIAIISGLMMPAIVGFCGLASETAYWYYRHRDIQGAADVAAFGAAVVLRRGGDAGEVAAAATADAAANGWRQANGTIVVNTPPTSGAYQNNLSVEVLLTENEQRYFTRFFFGNTTVPISVRATGTYASAGPACFLGLNPTQEDTIQFWGNSTAIFSACNVVSNSNHDDSFTVGGSANVTVPCAQAAGGSDVTATLIITDPKCGPGVRENAEPTPDPYKYLSEPTADPDVCSAIPADKIFLAGEKHCLGGTYNVTGDAEFKSGIHIFSGGTINFTATANVIGSGVMIFLTNGATVTSTGSPHLDLTAMTSGPYSGILLYSDRDNPPAVNTLNGDGTSSLTGAIYMPTQEFRFLGNFSGKDGCLQLVADKIEFTGNATFATDCTDTRKVHSDPGIIRWSNERATP
jgi:Flp pilus assembly protein TadG